MLEIGSMAPEFSLPDKDGNIVNLSDFRGKKVVLYFYPKDSTPGCTRQAKAFRDAFDKFAAENAVIIGISKDSVKSHANFATKQELQFILLSDTELTTLQAMRFGRRKSCMVKSAWVLFVLSMLLMKKAKSLLPGLK